MQAQQMAAQAAQQQAQMQMQAAQQGQERQDQQDAILRDVDAQAREDAWRTAQARLAQRQGGQSGTA